MSDPRELKLDIDENNLLQEWKGQAALMLDYGIKLADAMQEEDEARGELDVVKATLDAAIRANPEGYGIAKITENTVAAVVMTQREYAKADGRRNTALHDRRLLQAAVDAIGHRKSSLQGMTDLFMRQWYADPKSNDQPAELKDAAKSGPPTKTIPGREVRRRRVE